jgi:hypothetical protein
MLTVPSRLTRRATLVALAPLSRLPFSAPADLDHGFVQSGRLIPSRELARTLAVQPDCRFLIAGTIEEDNATDAFVRLNATLSPDRRRGEAERVHVRVEG